MGDAESEPGQSLKYQSQQLPLGFSKLWMFSALTSLDSVLLLVVEADLWAPSVQCFMAPTGAPRVPLSLPFSHRYTSSALCSPLSKPFH